MSRFKAFKKTKRASQTAPDYLFAYIKKGPSERRFLFGRRKKRKEKAVAVRTKIFTYLTLKLILHPQQRTGYRVLLEGV